MGLYKIGRAAFSVPLIGLYRCKIHGRENEPAEGPVLVCANHFSWWDPPLVGVAFKRQVMFMAKEELFRSRLSAWAMRKVGAFPVRRGRPDRKALQQALVHLNDGRMVGLFLEGTRSRTGETLSARPGAAWLALRAKVPIIPVALTGSYRAFKGVHVHIGEPFELEEYYHGKVNNEQLVEAGEKIMDRIRALMT